MLYKWENDTRIWKIEQHHRAVLEICAPPGSSEDQKYDIYGDFKQLR